MNQDINLKSVDKLNSEIIKEVGRKREYSIIAKKFIMPYSLLFILSIKYPTFISFSNTKSLVIWT